jgi:hypothetical protein
VRIATFGEQPGAAKVDVEHPVPFGNRHITDFPWTGYAGIRNKSVEASELRHGRIHKPGGHIDVAQVSGQSHSVAPHLAHRTGNFFLWFRCLSTTNCDLRALASRKCGFSYP